MSSCTFFTPERTILRSVCNFWHFSAQMMPNLMMARDKHHNYLNLCIFVTNMLPWRCIGWLRCLAQFNPDITNAIKTRTNALIKISVSEVCSTITQGNYSIWTVNGSIKALEQLNPRVTPAATPVFSCSVWVIRVHGVEWVLTSLSVIVLLSEACTDLALTLPVPWPLNGPVDRISTKTCHCCQVEESGYWEYSMLKGSNRIFYSKLWWYPQHFALLLHHITSDLFYQTFPKNTETAVLLESKRNTIATINASCPMMKLFVFSYLRCFIPVRVWLCFSSGMLRSGFSWQFGPIKERIHKVSASWQHLNDHHSTPCTPQD